MQYWERSSKTKKRYETTVMCLLKRDKIGFKFRYIDLWKHFRSDDTFRFVSELKLNHWHKTDLKESYEIFVNQP